MNINIHYQGRRQGWTHKHPPPKRNRRAQLPKQQATNFLLCRASLLNKRAIDNVLHQEIHSGTCSFWDWWKKFVKCYLNLKLWNLAYYLDGSPYKT